MAMARTPARRRRARRGSLERPVNGRLYRGSLLAALAAAPDPRVQHHPARRAAGAAPAAELRRGGDPAAGHRVSRSSFPDRAPGGAGIAQRRDSGSATSSRRTACPSRPTPGRAHVPGLGQVRLRNLWAVARRAVVGRDRRAWRTATTRAPGPARTTTPAAPPRWSSSRAATARPAPRPGSACGSAHTIVFLSTDGGSFGGLGAAPVREALAVPRRRDDQPRRRSRGGAPADRHHRRQPALTRGLARRDGREARARADRHAGHGAPASLAAADRPRVPVHPLRAGAVRRARHSGSHLDDRRRAAAGSVHRPGDGRSTRPGWPRSAARRRSSSARSTRASSWRRERRASSGSATGSSAAGRSSCSWSLC